MPALQQVILVLLGDAIFLFWATFGIATAVMMAYTMLLVTTSNFMATERYCLSICGEQAACRGLTPFGSFCAAGYTLGGFIFGALITAPSSYAAVAFYYLKLFPATDSSQRRRVIRGTIGMIFACLIVRLLEVFLLERYVYVTQALFLVLNVWMFFDRNPSMFFLRLIIGMTSTAAALLVNHALFPYILSPQFLSQRELNYIVSLGLPALFYFFSAITKRCLRSMLEAEGREDLGSLDAVLFLMYILYQLLQLTASVSRGTYKLPVIALSTGASCGGYILNLLWTTTTRTGFRLTAVQTSSKKVSPPPEHLPPARQNFASLRSTEDRNPKTFLNCMFRPSKTYSSDKEDANNDLPGRVVQQLPSSSSSSTSSPAMKSVPESGLLSHADCNRIRMAKRLWRRMGINMIVAGICTTPFLTVILLARNFFAIKLLDTTCFNSEASLVEAFHVRWHYLQVLLTVGALMTAFTLLLELMGMGMTRTWLRDRRSIMKTVLIIEVLYTPYLGPLLLRSILQPQRECAWLEEND